MAALQLDFPLPPRYLRAVSGVECQHSAPVGFRGLSPELPKD